MDTQVNIDLKEPKTNRCSITELYKELETISQQNGFFERNEINEGDYTNSCKSSNNRNIQNENQTSTLQGSLKIIFLIGQCLGVFPVTGFFEHDVEKVRFSFLTWKTLYSLFICGFLIMNTVLSFYTLLTKPLSLTTIIFVCFYTTTCMTSILCVRVAAKWPVLLLKLNQSRLDEYVDTKVKFKSKMITMAYVAFSSVLHILRVVDRTKKAMDRCIKEKDVLICYCEITYPWLFEFNFPYNRFTLVFLILLNIIAVMIWFYLDIFISCISLFLASILRKINEKVISVEGKSLPSIYWRDLREDYNRVTDVIQSFDEVISCLIFSSFSSNLFFVCFHVYYILSPLYSYEQSLYFISLATFMVLRFLSLALCVAEINSASLNTAPSLYKIHRSVFCHEVQRFIDQANGHIVALSGFKFFFVTREFVFSVFATIIKYELVLLQLNNDSIRL